VSSFNSVSEALDLLIDPFDDVGDWDEIVRRALALSPDREQRPRQLRFLAAAAVVVLTTALVVATPLGAAIGRALDGFGTWVTGQPGTPASPDAQKAFQAANARSWASFARGTELRKLLVTEASGATFTLYGFRSGGSLCLRLVVSGSVRGSTSDCAPLSALQTERTPAVVVAADEPFGSVHVRPDAQGYVPEAFSATFGIASDGVKRVTVQGDAGRADALIGGNAFLYVADHPKRGARIRAVDAVAANGTRVALPFASSPFGTLALAAPPTGKLHGPSRIERDVVGGTIGWIERREPRGRPAPANLRKRLVGSQLTRGAKPLLARLIQPDPRDFIRVGVIAVPASKLWNPLQHGRNTAKGIGVCMFTITHGDGIGGGCSTLQTLFRRQPFSVGIQGSGPSQFSILSGAASDDVKTIRLFVGDGSSRTVRLTDNFYLARIARADYPLRLVAYDRNGRVIGVQSFADDGMSSHAPAAARTSVRTIAVIRSGDVSATVQAGKPAGGFRCWTISFRSGASEGGCTPSPYHGPALAGLGALRPGRANSTAIWLAGQVSNRVKRVGITFVDGRTVTIDTHEGLVAYPIPAAELHRHKTFIALHGYDATGKEIAKHGMSFR
jgi:hypothetical protein